MDPVTTSTTWLQQMQLTANPSPGCSTQPPSVLGPRLAVCPYKSIHNQYPSTSICICGGCDVSLIRNLAGALISVWVVVCRRLVDTVWNIRVLGWPGSAPLWCTEITLTHSQAQSTPRPSYDVSQAHLWPFLHWILLNGHFRCNVQLASLLAAMKVTVFFLM